MIRKTRDLLFPLLAAMLLAGAVAADGPREITFDAFSIDINTAENAEIWIQLTFSEPINPGATVDLVGDSAVSAYLRTQDDPDFREQLELKFDADTLSLVSTGSSEELHTMVKRIYDGRARAYAYVNKDIPVVLADGTPGIIKSNTVRDFTQGKLRLSEAQRELLASAKSSGRLSDNDRLDISKEVGNADTVASEYIADFYFNRPLFESNWSISVGGRLSTRKDNPLNHVEACLQRALKRDSAFGHNLIYDFFFQGNIDGTQTLDTSILTLGAGVTALTPNLVDLTAGANRLRLKPIFTLRVDYMRHFRKQALYDNTSESFAASLDAYYYVPVADKYALIYEGNASFDNKRQIDDRLNFRNSFMVAYDLPLEDLKAVFKWETGKNEFITDTEAETMIGILLNYVSF